MKMTSHKGFSLLEIMIAVAILATSVVALLSAQGSSFLSSQRAERLTQATLLARKKMAEMEIEFQKDLDKNKFPEDDVEESGKFDEPFEAFRWSSSIKKVDIPVPDVPDTATSDSGEDNTGSENVAVASYLKSVMDEMSKQVRQVKLTVYWGDPNLPLKEQPQMTLTTHWVRLE